MSCLFQAGSMASLVVLLKSLLHRSSLLLNSRRSFADPNGPIFHSGLYHIFYQHVIGKSNWDWGLVWGHVSSPNLVDWKHEPIAIQPTVNQYDADGCWSGNVSVEQDGTPTMLYTGVRLRTTKSSIDLPPSEFDLNLEHIETICAAQCKSEDGQLTAWQKLREPVVKYPPSAMGELTGFRDPFIFAKRNDLSPWKMLIGSGIKGKGGTVLVYHAQSLADGWEFQGELIDGRSKPCQDGADYDIGAMWECPFFVKLNSRGKTEEQSPKWLLCVSPYPHHRTDRPTNPCLYWLGTFESEKFDMRKCAGPKLLDLGDVLYAPTIFCGTDQVIMVAWLQELRKGGAFDYAGCLSVPRILSLEEGCLRQDPAEELVQLRTGEVSQSSSIELSPSQTILLDVPRSDALDIAIVFRRNRSRATGLLFHSLQNDVTEVHTYALLIDWDAEQLQVITPKVLDEATMTFDYQNVQKRIGGPITLNGKSSLGLRVLIDHSLLEVFTEHGQALTTRMYWSKAASDREANIYSFCVGGSALLEKVEVHALRAIWREDDV